MYKELIDQKDFNSFLNFLLNENSIFESSQFLQTLYKVEDNKFSNMIDEVGNNKSKYYEPYMFLLYNEVITLSDLIDLSKSNFSLNDLYALCDDLSGNKASKSKVDFNKKFFIRDKIINLYYGQNNIKSYKDEENIKHEFDLIYNDISESDKAILANLPGLILPTGINSDNFYKYFVRINNNKALIEDYFPFYSFIFNNYYIPLSSNSTENLDKSYNKLYEYLSKGLKDPNILRNMNDEIKKSYSEVIGRLFKKIKSRTINYEYEK